MVISYNFRSQEQHMRVSDIRWDSDKLSISIGGVTISLTATEYRLLWPLHHGEAISYADLAALAYDYDVDDKVRAMMDKHIDRVRGKMRGTGIYIYCVLNYGYLLLPEIVPGERTLPRR